MATKMQENPEEAMDKELMKKKKNATKDMEVARAEFMAWYRDNVSTGVIPWGEPAISWMFSGWVAGESPRAWLTEEEKAELAKKEAAKEAAAKAAEAKKEAEAKAAEAKKEAEAKAEAAKVAAAKKAARKKKAKV